MITLFPFLATHARLAVGVTSAIVAWGMLSQALRVLSAPLVDVSLSLRTWCAIGTAATAVLLVMPALVPIDAGHEAVLCVLMFLLGATACLASTPLIGLMAHTVSDARKGRASAYYTIGGTAGTAAGGAAGIWIASHTGSALLSATILAALCVAMLPALFLVREPPRSSTATSLFGHLRFVGGDFWGSVKSRRTLLVIAAVMTPVGLGATANIWPAIAPEWHVSADLMSLLAGAGATAVTLMGCLMAGKVMDRIDGVAAWLLFSVLLCAAGAILAFSPRTPVSFSVSMLVYMTVLGACGVGYLAMIMAVIGRGAAAFKFAAINSLGNFPTAYMTAANGAIHDRYGVTMMLLVEAIGSLVLIVLFAAGERATRPADAALPEGAAVETA
jgi:MFS family permease